MVCAVKPHFYATQFQCWKTIRKATLISNCSNYLPFCVTVGERDAGVAKVAEWQHTMYGLDSGINSGATTVRDDDGEYTTSKHYTMTTTVTREEPGKLISHTLTT